jgi:hypothetical protein
MIEEVNSSMICLIYCKNFCKCHNVQPQAQQQKSDSNLVSSATLNLMKCIAGEMRKGAGKGAGPSIFLCDYQHGISSLSFGYSLVIMEQ